MAMKLFSLNFEVYSVQIMITIVKSSFIYYPHKPEIISDKRWSGYLDQLQVNALHLMWSVVSTSLYWKEEVLLP